MPNYQPYGNGGGPYRSNDRSGGAWDSIKGSFTGPGGGYHIPTWAIVLGFIFTWPLGLALLLARMFESPSTPEQGRQRQPQEQRYDGAAPQYAQAAQSSTAPQYAQPAPPPPSAAKKKSKPKSKKEKESSLPGWLTGIGIFTLAVGLLSAPDALSYAIAYGVDAWSIGELLNSGLWLLSGAGMLFGAARLRLGQRIRKKIAAIVGDASFMSIQEVADALPAKKEKTTRYLQQCIDNGVFGDKAYLDMRTDTLVVKGAPPARPKPEPQPEKEPATQDKYQAILQQLQDVNLAIPGEEMTAKIDRLTNVTAKIFELVEKNPEKLPQMRKFMDYYLPTSLKLLHSYAQLDAQGVEGANIRESKRQIESTMDTLVSAFEAQLDKLFYMDSIDISADIATMQNMMQADGLTGSVFDATVPQAPEPPHL